MKIGIISDTHDHIPASVYEAFSNVEQIIHAGDIGKENIITELSTIAPVKAVYGNMDSYPLVSRYRRIDFFNIHRYAFCLTHIIASHKAFSYELFKMNRKVDVVIHGHTHLPDNTKFNDILFINPGSASRPKSGSNASVGILNVDKELLEFEIIYLK
jgi:putative phosphoesterase